MKDPETNSWQNADYKGVAQSEKPSPRPAVETESVPFDRSTAREGVAGSAHRSESVLHERTGATHCVRPRSNGRSRRVGSIHEPSDSGAAGKKTGTILIFSQVYVPDPTSVGQHMADVAVEMVERGYRVVVLTADTDYNDPHIKFPRREVLSGVEVRRLPFSSLGKGSFAVRMLGAILFIIQATIIGLFTRGVSGVLVSTSPPLCAVAAVVLRVLRGIPFLYWVMDLNPDQLVALKTIGERSLPARLLGWINRVSLRKADRVVALDRFMAERLQRRTDLGSKISIVAPWPHEQHLAPVDHAENTFRARHDLQDKLVIMYSGNHSASNPLETLLEAALSFRDVPDVAFLFVGGGRGKIQVEAFIREHNLTNMISLPYQPLSELSHSLSAADVHVVSLGETMTGVIHPCKVYGAMACSRPILFLGPRPSHVADLLDNGDLGWHVAHSDVSGAVKAIEQIRSMSVPQRAKIGRRAQAVVVEQFSKELLCSAFCDLLADVVGGESSVRAGHPMDTFQIRRTSSSS